MRRITPYASRFWIILAIALAEIAVLPVIQSAGLLPGTAMTRADDDDGGGDDGDDGGGGGGSRGGYGGSSDGRRDDDDDRPRGDLRSLFRWPFQRAERAQPRRPVTVPDRSANEIVAIGLNEASITELTQGGFAVDRRIPIALTGGELVRLTIPRGMTLDVARQAVQSASPSASVDFNHFYQPEQQDSPECSGKGCTLVRHIVGWPAAQSGEAACAAPLPIGLIDTAINAKHASLANANIEVVKLGDETISQSAEQHGTAVAALLVGASGSRTPGLLPGAKLVAIDAFQRYRKTADIADVYDLVMALDLLASRGIRIINLSLSGPSNILFEQAVRAAIGKGTILIAAAGNEGPNAKPVYPAAYPDVIAVTAVDKQMKPYRRAVRGDHIDIAAPGVGVWTAASISGGRPKNGTSFAAPFVTAAASMLLGAKPDMTTEQVADELMRSASDMGEPGKDAVFGWGLLNMRTLCQS